MPHSILPLLEVAAPDGGVYVLSPLPAGERYREGAERAYSLSLVASASGTRRRAARRAAIIGAFAVSLTLGVGIYLILPERSGDGLSPTRSVPMMFLCSAFCFAPIGAVLGYLIGRDRRQIAPRFEARFERTVTIDGVDVGRLVKVASDVPTRTVVFVTNRGETRIELASEKDAVLLGDALQRAVPAESV